MNKVNYNELYYPRQIRVKHKDFRYSNDDLKIINLSVELRDINGIPDCKIGNFSLNFWHRTPKGVNKEEYTSTTRLERAVEKVLRNRSFEIIDWV